MGSLRQADLVGFTQEDPYLAREVGAIPKQQCFTACRIGIGADRQFSFLDEVPVQVAWDIKEEKLLDGNVYRWWRYEGKVDPKKTRYVRPGDEFIVVEFPYAIERIHFAPFKIGCRKGNHERPSVQRRFESPEELLTTVENFDKDYWERSGLLTAGLSMPEMSFSPDGPKRRYQKKALYVLGICEDFDSTVQELNRTAKAQELLRVTSNRTIRFWPGKISKNLRLYEEVAELGPVLLLVSIRQALAGPHRAGERWRGRPVMDLVDRIYRNHLNTYNRRVRRPHETTLEDEDRWAGDLTHKA